MDKAIFDHTMKALFKFSRSRGVAFFLAFLSMLFTVDCQRYAFPQVPPQKIGTIDEGGLKNKHFIVHAGDKLYDLTNPTTNSKVLTGTVLPATEPIYYDASRKEPYTKAEKSITNEVHIFLNSKYDSLALGTIKVPFLDISEVLVIKKSNPTGAIVAVVVGIGFLTLLGMLSLHSYLKGLGWGK